MRFAASRRKPERIYAHGNTRWQQSCSHSTAICNRIFTTRIELRTQEQPPVAEHRGWTHPRLKRPQPHPPHTGGAFHRRLQPLYTEKYKVSCSGLLPKTKPMQHSCSHYNAFCSIRWLTRISLHTWQHQMTTIMQPFHCDLQPQIQDTNRTTHTGTATRCRTHIRVWNDPSRTRPHIRGTFHRRLQPLYTEKYKVSCSGFLPKTSPTQHSCSHYNAFSSITWLPRISLHTWQHQMETIMQPFHCDLRPRIQDTNRTTHTGTTTRCRTQRRNTFASGTTPVTPAAHTRYLSSPAATTLHGKIQGFVLQLPPQNKAHATSMQPLQCVLPHDVANPHASTHMATPHDNNHAAIPMRSATTDSRNAKNYAHRNNHSLQNIEEEPIDLETIQTAPAAHRRCLSSPAAATLHGKIQGFVLRLPPQNKAHATFMQPLQCILQHQVANPHLSTHMATPHDNNHAAIPMRSATTGSRNAKNYAHRNNHSLQNTEEEPIDLETIQTAPAAHRRYLSSPAAATLHGKIQGFVLRLPPQHKPHATFMQVNSFVMYCYVV